jgi:hypothetical protein
MDDLSEHGRGVLVRAMRRCGAEAQAEWLDSWACDPPSGTTRQARHARLLRARSTAAASASLVAVVDVETRDFVLSEEFVGLRPFTASVQPKYAQFLATLLPSLDLPSCRSLFETAADALIGIVRSATARTQTDLLRFYSALALMYPGPVVHPQDFAGPFCEVWQAADSAGLLSNQELRIRLALLGAWTGNDAPLLDAAFDDSLRATALCGGYCYVRSDTRADVFERTAEIVRGSVVDPVSCLLPGRPEATLKQVVDWARMSLRESNYLRTPGQALFLLSAIAQVCEHAAELSQRSLVRLDTRQFGHDLRSFEHVQVMEKRRFWQLSEQLQDSAAKERLLSLWHKEYVFLAEHVA